MKLLSIRNIKSLGVQKTLDFEVDHPDHNFYAEGMVTSNSHSFSYGLIAAQTVYLKFKYPTQFFLSLLKMTKNEPDSIGEVSKISKEMSAFGIKLLPPNLSQMDFAIEGKDIRFGLSCTKGISEKTIDKIKNFKKTFKDKFEIFESAKEAGLSIGVLSALIQAGTLDKIAPNRVYMVYEAQIWNLLTVKEKKYVLNYAKSYGNSIPSTIKALVEVVKDEKSKPIIKASRLETIKTHSSVFREIYEKHLPQTDFVNWWYENALLGYTQNKKLIEIFNKDFSLARGRSLKAISKVKELPDKARSDFVGKLDKLIKSGKSKNGNPYAKFAISDDTDSIVVMIFSDHLDECKEQNGGNIPKEGDIVICQGTKKEGNMFFADSISVQQNRIYTKLETIKSRSLATID